MYNRKVSYLIVCKKYSQVDKSACKKYSSTNVQKISSLVRPKDSVFKKVLAIMGGRYIAENANIKLLTKITMLAE